jgi:hypothetical protein
MHPGRNTPTTTVDHRNKAVGDSSRDNNGNPSNNVNNNVTINCTPAQRRIVSFMDTGLDAVVALILKDPARFQLALQSGTLHQEL